MSIPETAPVPPAPAPGPKPSRSLASVLVVPLFLVLIGGGVYAYFYFTTKPTDPPDPNRMFAGYLTNAERYAKLSADYQDDGTNGKMVAGKPKDGKYIDPRELLFTDVAGDDPEARAAQWEPFLKFLSEQTKKPVKYTAKRNVPTPPAPPPTLANPDERPEQDDNPAEVGRIRTWQDQLNAVKAGELHVAAFSTGQVPAAVNTAGFVPLAAPADKDGRFGYEMVVIVPASSPAKTVADLKGKTVGLVALSSNSGGKAPLVVFREEFQLKPHADYTVSLTGNHFQSMKLVAEGKLDAACVASDLLRSAVAEGRMKESDVRVLYTSKQVFPAVCLGVPHQLHPDLRAKIAAAFAAYNATGPGSVWETRYKGQGRVKFGAVNYEKDWEPVRAIDQKLTELLKAN